VFRSFNFIKESYIADVVSAVLVYHGFYQAPNGLNQTSISGGVVDPAIAQFMIAKEVRDVSGNTTSMKWASQSFDQIWNNRAALSYI